MKETWTVRALSPGDHIRVDRGAYYHHGIYIGNGEAIHYCAENGDGLDAPDTVEVRRTPMDRFTKNGFCEVLDYGKKDKKRRSPEDIVEYAKSALGRRGYDILNNNCEHFANECVYGEGFSPSVEDVRARVRELFRKSEK